MKFKFKVQPYQTNAVDSVVDCFAGQPNNTAHHNTYTIDPGNAPMPLQFTGFKNADLHLSDSQLKVNIREVQQRQNLPLSEALISSAKCRVNLDVEMETGTGKTYCYIKTIFELNKLYGWNKFIIVVPSIAIREGVYKSLEITADHFTESFGKKVRFFIYNSKQLHQIESFSSDASINVMIINIQAFNATGDVNESTIRRIQIRETIKAHLDKEKSLFAQGIKVLSLFFIDEVAKYRDYSQTDEKGEYARIFEEEYDQLKAEYLGELTSAHKPYQHYLERDMPDKVHEGYFSIDKNKRLVNPESKLVKDEETGTKTAISDDTDAYDLILKNKERLLSFAEPVRFIFSHSALREGWDNPNVFVICMLKHSDNTISRRQEVGRGLRLSVNQNGDRMDHPATVHDINVLTVVASESYKEFVTNLQKEISNSLSARPGKADEEYFTGKIIQTESGPLEINPVMAKQIYKYLLKNDYTDDADKIAPAYHTAKADGTLVPPPPELAPQAEQIYKLIDSVFSDSQLPQVEDDRKPKANPLNNNFGKKEFKALWNQINHKAIYRVEFDSAELVRNCIRTLDNELRVSPLYYTIHAGTQKEQITDQQLKSCESFKLEETAIERQKVSIHSMVKYDLLGKLAGIESTKIECARKFFEEINERVERDKVKYDVITDFGKLMEIVTRITT